MNDPHHSHDIVVPRGALIGAGLLLALTISLVMIFRLGGIDPAARVADADQSIAERALRFEDSDDGSVLVYSVSESSADEVIHVVHSGEGGFIRGVLRSLARARNASGISREHPFVLELQNSGTLVLEDPQTGQRIDLQAFGPTNIAAFRTLLQADQPLQTGGGQNGSP